MTQTLFIAGAYLLGSIPVGLLLGRWLSGVDVRTVGSGNIGMTNVARASGLQAGILTLLLDAAKGWVPVFLALRWFSIEVAAAASVAAVAGHIFPLYLRFRGGKGVATGCGAFLALAPPALGIALLAFGLAVIISRFISLGSVAAAVVFPLSAWFLREPSATLVAGALCALLIVIRHLGNLRRIFGRVEPRVGEGKK